MEYLFLMKESVDNIDKVGVALWPWQLFHAGLWFQS